MGFKTVRMKSEITDDADDIASQKIRGHDSRADVLKEAAIRYYDWLEKNDHWKRKKSNR